MAKNKLSEQELLENYDKISLKKLPEILKKKTFEYRLVKRTNNKLIYSQHNGLGVAIAYEVFKNKIKPLRETKVMWSKRGNIEINPEDFEEYYEVFPTDEDFGKRAWSYGTLETAMKAFNEK